jgi:hypothetical protein
LVEEVNMSKPIWLDNNVLVKIDNGREPRFETEIAELQKEGHEVLIPKKVETEFLYGQKFRPQDTLRRKGILERLKVKVDTMANQVPMKQLQGWREEAINHGLSITDADIVAEVRASAQARGISNPVLYTGDARAVGAMRRRGVLAEEFRPRAPKPELHVTVPKVVEAPRPGFIRARISNAKFALKEGLKGAFSPEGLASMIPDIVLAIADRVAAKEAIKNIEVKFVKEGFGKGVAAGVLGWTDDEVQLNLKNRITPFRVEGMEDPAGFLTRAYILQLAEAYENYGVDVGFQWTKVKPLDWKNKMVWKGMSLLAKYNYHYPNNPDVLFTYDVAKDLAWVLRSTTDAIVEPAIKDG